MGKLRKEIKYKWNAELLFWGLTTLIVTLFVLPVYNNTFDFPFLWQNIAFIAISLTFVRWIFLWKLTPYSRARWFILTLICIQPFLIFVLITLMNDFQSYLQGVGMFDIVGHLSMEDSMNMSQYIRAEMLLFAICSIIAAAALFIRMIIQMWRLYNDKI